VWVPLSKAAVATRLYGLLTGDDDARVCKDSPDSAYNDQPRNYLLHLLSHIATKVGDERANARRRGERNVGHCIIAHYCPVN